jgi:queuine/archaeosine tRNA-ribosyltransferase
MDTDARLSAEIAGLIEELARAQATIEQGERDLEERTVWAQRLDREKQELEQQLALVRISRWIKLGRKVGLGPIV